MQMATETRTWRAAPRVTTTEQQVAEKSFDASDVFAFDIVMSTGEGKARPAEQRTTVYKRDVEEKYSLKMKASRAFFSEVNARFPTLPFTLRAGDEKTWRLGVTECVKHDLFIEYPVLYEKPEEFVAGPLVSVSCRYLVKAGVLTSVALPPKMVLMKFMWAFDITMFLTLLQAHKVSGRYIMIM